MFKRLLILAFALMLVLGAACGGDDDDDNGGNGDTPAPGETPIETSSESPTETPPAMSTTGTVTLSAPQASVGEGVSVTGSGWLGEGPVQFYLLTEEQSGDNQTAARAIANGEVGSLGESAAGADGAISFDFTLEASYSTASGGTLTVASGASLTVFALQDNSGSRSEPLTVV